MRVKNGGTTSEPLKVQADYFMGLKKYGKDTEFKIGECLEDANQESNKKVSFADLVLSVLSWPFHKDLPTKTKCKEKSAGSQQNKAQ